MEAVVNHINAEADMTDTFRNDVENRITETAQAVRKAVNKRVTKAQGVVRKRVTKAKGVVRKRVTKAKKTAATAIKRAKAFVKQARGKVTQTKRRGARGTPIGKGKAKPKAKTAAPKRKAAKTKKAAAKRSALKSVKIVPPAI